MAPVHTYTLVVVACISVCLAQTADDRGFGSQYTWYTFDEAREASMRQELPVMYIIHKSWCPASYALKLSVAASPEVLALANRFIFVNLEDDEEPAGIEWAPDGRYYPRVLFGRPFGGLELHVHNKVQPSAQTHFYGDAAQLAAGMELALQVMGAPADEGAPAAQGQAQQADEL